MLPAASCYFSNVPPPGEGHGFGNATLPSNYLAHFRHLCLDLNFCGSLPCDVRWDCFPSQCFSFCSVVWETPSNHQQNLPLCSQPSQSRKENCLFQLGFLNRGVCQDNLSASLQCPICQLTDKAQRFLARQFCCQQLCFICSQSPCRGLIKWMKTRAKCTDSPTTRQQVNTSYLSILPTRNIMEIWSKSENSAAVWGQQMCCIIDEALRCSRDVLVWLSPPP